MSPAVPDDNPEVRMRLSRNAAEYVLFGLREVRVSFDREGLAERLRAAISQIYRAMDVGPDSLARSEALMQASTCLSDAGGLLSASPQHGQFQIQRLLGALKDAQAHARVAAEIVAMDQLQRRMQLGFGEPRVETSTRPFRVSQGEPELYALNREAVIPLVDLGEADPVRSPRPEGVAVAPPQGLDELRALAKNLGSQVAEQLGTSDLEAETDEDQNKDSLSDSVGRLESDRERQFLEEAARDTIEDIASLGSLRQPIETESWQDQGPFEQRLLQRLDYLVSLGQPAFRAALLYHAESDSPDPARAFALALALGCIEGSDAIDAIVATLRQSAPEEHPGFLEGLVLGTNPGIADGMRRLLGMNDPKLVALAFEVLMARRELLESDVQVALQDPDPVMQARVARALGTNLEVPVALAHLDRMLLSTACPSPVWLELVEAGLRRGHGPAREELRRAVQISEPGGFPPRAGFLLGISGTSRDVESLLQLEQAAPSPLLSEALGRLGHVAAIPRLIERLEEGDEVMAPVAARELQRLTGAGMFEETEEPWVKELPPEADLNDIPIPTHVVRRVTTNPLRWRDWERTQGRNLDGSQRYRLGKPFAVSAILGELWAKEPRPEDRARASLELSVATGKDYGLSVTDWVTRQQRCLERAAEHLRRLSSPEGGWCFAGVGMLPRPMDPTSAAAPANAHREEPGLPLLSDAPIPWLKPSEPAVVAPPPEPERPLPPSAREVPAFLRQPSVPAPTPAAAVPSAVGPTAQPFGATELGQPPAVPSFLPSPQAIPHAPPRITPPALVVTPPSGPPAAPPDVAAQVPLKPLGKLPWEK